MELRKIFLGSSIYAYLVLAVFGMSIQCADRPRLLPTLRLQPVK